MVGADEYLTHAPNAIPKSVGGIITESNLVYIVNVRQWLASTQFVLAFFFLVGHLWNGAAPAPLLRTWERAATVRSNTPSLCQISIERLTPKK
jgi:hypothetical protein